MADTLLYRAVSDYHGPNDEAHVITGETYRRPPDSPLVLAGVLVPVPEEKAKPEKPAAGK